MIANTRNGIKTIIGNAENQDGFIRLGVWIGHIVNRNAMISRKDDDKPPYRGDILTYFWVQIRYFWVQMPGILVH